MPDSNRLIAWTCGKSENIFVWIWHNFKIIDGSIMSKESSTNLDLLSIFHVPNQSHLIRVENDKLVSLNIKSCSKGISVHCVFSCLNFNFWFSNLPVDFPKRWWLWKSMQMLQGFRFKDSNNTICTTANYTGSIEPHSNCFIDFYVHPFLCFAILIDYIE